MCLLRKTIQNAFGGTLARSHQKDGWDRDVWDGVAPISVFLFFLQRHVLPYVNLSRSSLQMNGLSRALKYLDVFSSSLRLSVTMDMLLLTTVVLFLVCLQLCFKRQLIFFILWDSKYFQNICVESKSSLYRYCKILCISLDKRQESRYFI